MCGSSSSGEMGIQHAGHGKRVAACMTLHTHLTLSPGTFTVDSIRKVPWLAVSDQFQRSEWLDAWALHREPRSHGSNLACCSRSVVCIPRGRTEHQPSIHLFGYVYRSYTPLTVTDHTGERKVSRRVLLLEDEGPLQLP